MIGQFGQTPPAMPDDGAAKMVTMIGRDREWSLATMGQLFAHVTTLNLTPVRWEVGLFVLRDLVHARDPHFQLREWRLARPETVWGCGVTVVCFEDHVELVAEGLMCGREGNLHRFAAKG